MGASVHIEMHTNSPQRQDYIIHVILLILYKNVSIYIKINNMIHVIYNVHQIFEKKIYMYTGWPPPKKPERHTSGNKGIEWLVSVDGVSSLEKNDTKINNFG